MASFVVLFVHPRLCQQRGVVRAFARWVAELKLSPPPSHQTTVALKNDAGERVNALVIPNSPVGNGAGCSHPKYTLLLFRAL